MINKLFLTGLPTSPPAGTSTSTGDVIPPAPATQTSPHASGLVPANIKRIDRESGGSIRGVKHELEWTAATGLREKAAHRFNALVGKRTREDGVSAFVRAVVDNPEGNSKSCPDPVDPGYRQISTQTGTKGRLATLSVNVNASDPDDAHISAFTHVLANDLALQQGIKELKDHGWTLRYGRANSFNAGAKTATIAYGKPEQAAKSLSRALLTHVFEDGTRTSMGVLEQAYLYARTLENPYPKFPPHALTSFTLPEITSFDGGFMTPFPAQGVYNALCRNLDSTKRKHRYKVNASFDPNSMPGIDKHDAVMLLAYRVLWSQLNGTLRDPVRRPHMAPLAERINASLARFPSYDGLVVRKLGSWLPKSTRPPVPAETISWYESRIDQTIVDPAFVSASKNEASVLDRFKPNVTVYIQSRTGKDLGSLSPYSEVLFAAGTTFRVLDVHYLENSKGTPFPKAEITLMEVDPTAPPSSGSGNAVASTSGT